MAGTWWRQMRHAIAARWWQKSNKHNQRQRRWRRLLAEPLEDRRLLSLTWMANDMPTISDIPDQTTLEDAPQGPIAFTVGDVETQAGSLTVTGSSDNPTLIPNANLVLDGSDANRTLTLTPAADQFGTATITVTVSDGTAIASEAFVLTVTAVNDAPMAGSDAYTASQDAPTSIVAPGLLGNDSDIDEGDTLRVIEVSTRLQTVTVPLADLLGTYGAGQTRNAVFDAGVQFSSITNLAVRWAGQIMAGLGDGDGVEALAGQPFLLGASFLAVTPTAPPYSVGSISGGTTFRIPEPFDAVTRLEPWYEGAYDLLRSGRGQIRVEFDPFIVIGGVMLVPPAGAIAAAELLITGTVQPDGSVGSVTWNADGSFIYDPGALFEHLAPGATATDAFTYTVSDDRGLTATAAVTMTIRADPTSWRNSRDACDVSGDGSVSPLDALILVNLINGWGPRELPAPSKLALPPPFLDPNGDGRVDASDVLYVINCINRWWPTGEREQIKQGGSSNAAGGEPVEGIDGGALRKTLQPSPVEDAARQAVFAAQQATPVDVLCDTSYITEGACDEGKWTETKPRESAVPW